MDLSLQTHSPSSPAGPSGPETGSAQRERIRRINRAIQGAEAELRVRHPWLNHQNALGLAVFLFSLGMMGGLSVGYLSGGLTAWLVIPGMAFAISLLHELEHDLIHNLYFKGRPLVQNALFLVIWLAKLNLNPWYRKEIHTHHHRVSGQLDDIEERLIGLGLPLGPLRALVALHPLGALFLLRRIKRDAPTFQMGRMMWTSFPTYLLFAVMLQLYLSYVRAAWLHPSEPFRLLPAWGWPVAQALMVLWVAPNILRQASLVLMSSYCHYFEDIPRHEVLYQTQILRHPLLWPLQLFCFNFGSTHIIHHVVVDQPFYIRQAVAGPAHRALEAEGVRVNDFGVVRRANRWLKLRPV